MMSEYEMYGSLHVVKANVKTPSSKLMCIEFF